MPLETDILRQAHAEGQQAWPGSTLAPTAFADHLERLAVPADAVAARAVDLYLAVDCARGDELAIRRFEAHYIAGLDAYVARLHLAADQLKELRQQARVAFLVGPDPLVANYRGSGALGAWVRVIVVRMALHLLEAVRAEQQRNDDLGALEALAATDLTPEAGAIKARYHERVQAALKGALAGLGEHERTLLRLHFLDGLSIDAIGRIYRVHRATVARWLVAIRSTVLTAVRDELRLPEAGGSSDLRSLVGLLRGDLELSLRRLLG